MLNIDVLREAVEWVEFQDSLPVEKRSWYQGDWVAAPSTHASYIYIDYKKDVNPADCGSAYCVAGYIGQAHDKRYKQTATVDGKHVSEFATEVLGIDKTWWEDDEGHYFDLFDGDNSADDIRHIAEMIAEQHGTSL
jgi:hypothetical protein